MPAVQRTTAETILRWEPSEAQRKHGFQVFASRLIKEGLRFEAAGDMVQAELRFRRCKAYCQLRQINFPPFATDETALIKAVAADDSSDGARGVKVSPPGRVTGAGPKRKPGHSAPSETLSRQQIHGRKLAAQRMLKAGNGDAARAYCEKNGLPFPPFGPISGESRGESRDAATAEGVTITAHESAPPESFSGDGTQTAVGEAGTPQLASVADTPPSPESLSSLPLAEQLRRQMAAIDAAERAQEAADRRAMETEHGVVTAPAAPQPTTKWVATPKGLLDTETGEVSEGYVLTFHPDGSVTKSAEPDPLAPIAHTKAVAALLGSAGPTEAPVPESRPTPAVPGESAGPALPPGEVRKAVVWTFPRNRSLAVIAFPEGDKPLELCRHASLLLEWNRPVQMNEEVEVVVVPGETGPDPLWELAHKP